MSKKTETTAAAPAPSAPGAAQPAVTPDAPGVAGAAVVTAAQPPAGDGVTQADKPPVVADETKAVTVVGVDLAGGTSDTAVALVQRARGHARVLCACRIGDFDLQPNQVVRLWEDQLTPDLDPHDAAVEYVMSLEGAVVVDVTGEPLDD